MFDVYVDTTKHTYWFTYPFHTYGAHMDTLTSNLDT